MPRHDKDPDIASLLIEAAYNWNTFKRRGAFADCLVALALIHRRLSGAEKEECYKWIEENIIKEKNKR